MATGIKNSRVDMLNTLKKYVLAASTAGKYYRNDCISVCGTSINRRVLEGVVPKISRGDIRGIEKINKDSAFTVTSQSCVADWPVNDDMQFSPHMAAYLLEYQTRSLKMAEMYTAKQFGQEYQCKEICAQHRLTGLVVTRKTPSVTLGDLVTTVREYIAGVDSTVGYVCTMHDPQQDCELVLDIFGDPQFDSARIDTIFGTRPKLVTAQTAQRKKDSSGHNKICIMGHSTRLGQNL